VRSYVQGDIRIAPNFKEASQVTLDPHTVDQILPQRRQTLDHMGRQTGVKGSALKIAHALRTDSF
jgi:hypothetical protein